MQALSDHLEDHGDPRAPLLRIRPVVEAAGDAVLAAGVGGFDPAPYVVPGQAGRGTPGSHLLPVRARIGCYTGRGVKPAGRLLAVCLLGFYLDRAFRAVSEAPVVLNSRVSLHEVYRGPTWKRLWTQLRLCELYCAGVIDARARGNGAAVKSDLETIFKGSWFRYLLESSFKLARSGPYGAYVGVVYSLEILFLDATRVRHSLPTTALSHFHLQAFLRHLSFQMIQAWMNCLPWEDTRRVWEARRRELEEAPPRSDSEKRHRVVTGRMVCDHLSVKGVPVRTHLPAVIPGIFGRSFNVQSAAARTLCSICREETT